MAEKPAAFQIIRTDFNTDVLWKPPRISTRARTISTDSSGSDVDPAAISPSSNATQQRRFSFTQYFTGGGSFLNRQRSMDSESSVSGMNEPMPQKKSSITESADFQELLRRQKRILEQ